jgi:membrane-bound acyltransferase YfiQ involved in biofilm formation
MSTSKEVTKLLKNRNASKVMLMLSALAFLFYLSVQVLISNVYKYAVVGALFELLSMPMLLLLVVIPILSIVQLIKLKGTARVYALMNAPRRAFVKHG